MKQLISLAMVLAATAALAQPVIKFSKTYPRFQNEETFGYVAAGDNVVALKFAQTASRETGFFLRKFDRSKPALVSEYFIADQEGGPVLIAKIKGKVYVFFAVGRETSKLIAREVNMKTGTFVGAGRELMTFDQYQPEYFMGEMLPILRSPVIRFSADSSMFLFKYDVAADKKHRTKKASTPEVALHVFNADLTERWNKKITLPYGAEDVVQYDYSLDAQGNVYGLARIKTSEGISIGAMKVHGITGEVTHGEVPVTKEPSRLRLCQTAKGLLGAGYYASDDVQGVDGILALTVDTEGKPGSVNYSEIPAEVITQFMSKAERNKIERRKQTGMPQLVLQQVIPQPDGGCVIVGQREWSEPGMSLPKGAGGRPAGRMPDVYFVGNLLVARVNPSGDAAWIKTIAHRFRGTPQFRWPIVYRPTMPYYWWPSDWPAFQYFKRNGNHYLLIADEAENQNLAVDKEPAEFYAGSEGRLTLCKITDTGEYEKIHLMTTQGNANNVEIGKFAPDRVALISPTEIFCEFVEYYKDQDIAIKIAIP